MKKLEQSGIRVNKLTFLGILGGSGGTLVRKRCEGKSKSAGELWRLEEWQHWNLEDVIESWLGDDDGNLGGFCVTVGDASARSFSLVS